MNKKQGIVLVISVVLIVVVFLFYAQIVSNLQMNPIEAGRLKIERRPEISSAISDRNGMIKAIAVITIVSLFFLREKKVKQPEYQTNTINSTMEKNGEVTERDKILSSLINLKNNGVITEEEFLDKIRKL